MLVYIHIPFCESKCFYCNFNSIVNDSLKNEYFKALYLALKFELNKFSNEKIQTLYIGGGTPSIINPKYFEKIFLEFSNIEEITIEANPNSATYEWLREIKNLGVNRVSFGVQSFNQEKLKFLGRTHSNKDAIKSVENADKLGIKNISIDFIYNTFVDSKELLLKDLNLATKLPLNHLSAYSLTLEENSKFASDFSKISKEDFSEFFINEIKEKEFLQYEISNFAKGYKSKHNLGYWEYKNYIGVGAGSVGFYKNKRFYPPKNLKEYINNPLKIEIEELSEDDIKIEKIFLGLRSEVGVDLKIFNQKELNKIKILIDAQKLYLKNEKIFNLNYLLSDEVVLFITNNY
jgi:oxygen-independent coproporphyrinogen III oxidase